MSSQPLLPRDQESREDGMSVLTTSCCCCCIGACYIFQMGFMAACLAFSCFLFSITGHAILRLTDPAVYGEFSIHSSMQVGAAGGVILLPVLLIVSGIEECLAKESSQHSFIVSVTLNMWNLGRSIAAGALAGWAGSKVLLSHGYTVLDPRHAARAGALGGTVLGPCIIIGTILLALILIGTSRRDSDRNTR